MDANIQSRLRGLLRSAIEHEPANADESGVQGFLIGAAYALMEATKMASTEGTYEGAGTVDYSPAAAAMMRGHPPSKGWIYGYHLNNALYRCAALFGRISKTTHTLLELDMNTRQLLERQHLRMDSPATSRTDANELLQFLERITDHYFGHRRESDQGATP